MLGRKKGKFGGGEKVCTPRCVNLVEEKKKASTLGRRKGDLAKGKNRVSTPWKEKGKSFNVREKERESR